MRKRRVHQPRQRDAAHHPCRLRSLPRAKARGLDRAQAKKQRSARRSRSRCVQAEAGLGIGVVGNVGAARRGPRWRRSRAWSRRAKPRASEQGAQPDAEGQRVRLLSFAAEARASDRRRRGPHQAPPQRAEQPEEPEPTAAAYAVIARKPQAAPNQSAIAIARRFSGAVYGGKRPPGWLQQITCARV